MKFLFVTVFFIAAVSADPVYRHRWQMNAANLKFQQSRGGSRIVGGRDTDITEVPHQVVLHFRRSFTCGGSILNTNTMLSAAHCTFNRDHSDFQILVGQTNRQFGDLIDVSEVREHPDYDDFTLDHDMVILKTSVHLVEGPTIRRATLPPPSDYVLPGYEAVVSGFGDLAWGSREFPDILQSVRVTVKSNQECQEIYPDEVIHDFHLCAGDYGRDACQGDSGGPLTQFFGQPQATVIGVVNWGYFCAFEWPTVYSRVSSYLGWILTNMAN